MAFGGIETVSVVGMAELRAAFKGVDVGFANTEKELNRKIADDVAAKAQAAGIAMGSVFAKSAPSVKSGSSAPSAWIKYGGPNYLFALGAEFGSVRYKQFRDWRGNGGDAGYFLYPTIRAERSHIEQMAADAVTRLLEIFPI